MPPGRDWGLLPLKEITREDMVGESVCAIDYEYCLRELRRLTFDQVIEFPNRTRQWNARIKEFYEKKIEKNLIRPTVFSVENR